MTGHPGLRADRWGAGVEYAIDGAGWYPDLARSFVMTGLERLGVPPSCWRDVLLADVAATAAAADHDEFARQPPAAVPPPDRTPLMTMTHDAAGTAAEGPCPAGPRQRPACGRDHAGRRRHLPADAAPDRPGNSSPVDLLIVAAIVTAMVWLAGTHRKLRAPYVIPAGLFIAAGAASGLVSPLPTTALVTLAIDILLFAWCTTVVNVLSGPRAMRYALVAWSWSGIVWAAIFIAAWLGHITPLEGLNPAEGNRLAFTFGDPNYASWFWDSTIFVSSPRARPAGGG